MRKSYGLPYSKLDVVKSMWASVHSIQTLIQFSAAIGYKQGILTVWSLVSTAIFNLDQDLTEVVKKIDT